MARIWNLRFNLDEFNAAMATLSDDSDRSSFLIGMSCGCNAGKAKDAPQAWVDGYAMGSAMRSEADGYVALKSEAGKKSAEARRTVFGTAQPQKPILEQTSNSARTDPEQTSNTPSNSARTNPQSTIKEKEPTVLGVRERKPREKKPTTGPSIAEILKTDGTHDGDRLHDRYWITARFWDSTKNPKPREAAIEYRKLYDAKQNLREVADGASAYRASFLPPNRQKDETQYMIGFLEWLKQEGWQNYIEREAM